MTESVEESRESGGVDRVKVDSVFGALDFSI